MRWAVPAGLEGCTIARCGLFSDEIHPSYVSRETPGAWVRLQKDVVASNHMMRLPIAESRPPGWLRRRTLLHPVPGSGPIPRGRSLVGSEMRPQNNGTMMGVPPLTRPRRFVVPIDPHLPTSGASQRFWVRAPTRTERLSDSQICEVQWRTAERGAITGTSI